MVYVDDLKESDEFFKYQRVVNSKVDKTPSHVVIDKYINKYGEDYRYEDKPHVEKALRDRKVDNTDLGRKKGV